MFLELFIPVQNANSSKTKMIKIIIKHTKPVPTFVGRNDYFTIKGYPDNCLEP